MLFEQVAYIGLQQKNLNEVFGFHKVLMADFNQCYSNSHCSINLFVLYFDQLLLCQESVTTILNCFVIYMAVLRPKAIIEVSLQILKRSKSCTLVAHYEARTKSGHHIRYAQLVLLVYTIGYATKRHRCLLLFP